MYECLISTKYNHVFKGEYVHIHFAYFFFTYCMLDTQPIGAVCDVGSRNIFWFLESNNVLLFVQMCLPPLAFSFFLCRLGIRQVGSRNNYSIQELIVLFVATSKFCANSCPTTRSQTPSPLGTLGLSSRIANTSIYPAFISGGRIQGCASRSLFTCFCRTQGYRIFFYLLCLFHALKAYVLNKNKSKHF